MKEEERQKYSIRLCSVDPPDGMFKEEIGRLKAGERYEVISASLALHGSNPAIERPTCFQALIPNLIGDDYVRGLKADVASKRIAALVKAARRIGGLRCEAAVLIELLHCAGGNSGQGHMESDLVVGAARMERPSTGALAHTLRSDAANDFASLSLWGRLASIASASISPVDENDLIEAIDGLIDRRGAASNVVPPELHVLRRSLGRGALSGEPANGQGARPSEGQFSSARALQELAAYITRLEGESASGASALAEARIDKARTEEAVSILERRQRDLESTISRAQSDVAAAIRERAALQDELNKTGERARQFEAKLHDTESLLQGSTDSMTRSAQRKLREQCQGPLEELGEYVKLAAKGTAVDADRLLRSFERFEKTFRRATGSPMETPEQKAPSE
jgi:hypothetical protein